MTHTDLSRRREQALQEADDGMTEEEWAGALHWKTWVLAGLDICISTIKCERLERIKLCEQCLTYQLRCNENCLPTFVVTDVVKAFLPSQASARM